MAEETHPNGTDEEPEYREMKLRLPPTVHAMLHELARLDRRSMNTTAIVLIEREHSRRQTDG